GQLPRLAELDEADLATSRIALARALEPDSRPLAEFAGDCWQAYLAGLPAEHPRTLAEAVERLDRSALQDCLSQLVEARHGWLLLASASSRPSPFPSHGPAAGLPVPARPRDLRLRWRYRLQVVRPPAGLAQQSGSGPQCARRRAPAKAAG